jgi:hypothetical protein
VLVEGEMVPIDRVTDEPQWMPWVYVGIVSPERAKWWLSNGVYTRTADLCAAKAPAFARLPARMRSR